MRITILLFAFCLIVVSENAMADFTMQLDNRFRLKMEAEGEQTGGIDILSASGSLLPGPTADSGPFLFKLANVPHQVTFGNLGNSPNYEGTYILPTRWNPAGVPDVEWSYGKGATPVGPFSLFEGVVQANPDPGISVGLNDDYHFVLNGSGQELIGVSFQSPSGSLVPGPTGDAGPFSVVYENESQQLSYGSIGNDDATVLDGQLTLTGSWNPLGINDVTYHYNQVGPIHSGTLPLDIDPTGIDALSVSLDDQYRFVLQGAGQLVEELSFSSESGSLLPASVSQPFGALAENSASQIRFSSDAPVAIDGAVTLDARWNRNLGIRDVRVGYTTPEIVLEDTLLPGSIYPAPPVDEPVKLSIDFEDSTLTLRGQGQELRNITFTSPSGTLDHYDVSGGPFESVVLSTNQRVEFETSEFVTIDGSLRLPVKYSIGGGLQDIQFRYEQVGLESPRGPFDAVYPFTQSRLSSFVDQDGFIVVQGNGHRVSSLHYRSESGALLPGESSEPFDSFSSNSFEEVELLGNVTIDGQLILSTQWNESIAADIEFTYTLDGNEMVFGTSGLSYPSKSVITVLATPGQTDSISLIGEGQLITGLEVFSPSGSLLLEENPNFGSFDIVEEYSPDLIRLSSSTEVAIDVTSLPFLWDPNGEPDLEFSFDFPGPRVLIGRVLYSDQVVPEPASGLLLLPLMLAVLDLNRHRGWPRTRRRPRR